MKVLAHSEEDTKQVLIGQKHVTEEFTIANTPAMMNVLSTGLYENPLKAVVREIMFNAWDAQKDNNKADQPIEVTVNIDNGILIRDFGKGIPQDKIHSIYCVYGASTKVDVAEATGGFGFGTKAPFSYADAFTVISYHDGVKSVNLINKVGENTGGKPGRTLIAQVPTEEEGIAVTVGLKNIDDVHKIIRHVKEISFLSGMKILFTYNETEDNKPEDTVVELLEDNGIEPYEMLIKNTTSKRGNDDQGVYAVYGGVRYPIPQNEAYEEAYKSLNIFTRNRAAVYFGFAPNTLTPQPSRDGLNMSDITIKSITNILNNTQEEITYLASEAVSVVLEAFFEAQKELETLPELVLKSAADFFVCGNNLDFERIGVRLNKYVSATTIKHKDNYSWNNILKLANDNFSYLLRYVNKEFNERKRCEILRIFFAKYYPEEKRLQKILKTYFTMDEYSSFHGSSLTRLIKEESTNYFLNKSFIFETKMEKIITAKSHKPKLMIESNVSYSSD